MSDHPLPMTLWVRKKNMLNLSNLARFAISIQQNAVDHNLYKLNGFTSMVHIFFQFYRGGLDLRLAEIQVDETSVPGVKTTVKGLKGSCSPLGHEGSPYCVPHSKYPS